MALNQDFDFEYEFEPYVPVRLICDDTGRETVAQALLDTGASITVFDLSLASELGLDLDNAPVRYVMGIEGTRQGARIAEIEVWLLDEPDLSLTFLAAFAPGINDTVGNLIGLDVLSHFDLGLQHGLRRGSLGVTLR